tara:strand:+ start:26 stop:361 length:336 start_codon:yes stop_codon:yes gene_type:complete
MGNPIKGQISITLDKEYNARLTIDAITQIEEKLDCGILKIVNELSTMDIRVNQIVAILTPALRGGGNQIQESDVKKIITEIGIVKSIQVMADLLTRCLTVESEGEQSEKKD